MYRCSHWRATSSTQVSVCPQCGVRFADTKAVDRLLPTREEEAAARSRKERLARWSEIPMVLSLSTIAAGAGVLKKHYLPDHRGLVITGLVVSVLVAVWSLSAAWGMGDLEYNEGAVKIMVSFP